MIAPNSSSMYRCCVSLRREPSYNVPKTATRGWQQMRTMTSIPEVVIAVVGCSKSSESREVGEDGPGHGGCITGGSYSIVVVI